MSRTQTENSKYPVFIRFIVQEKQIDKFNDAMRQLIMKHQVENVKLVSVVSDSYGEEDNVIIWRIEVPTSVKKEAEKYLHFTHDIFAKLGVDFYPAYTETPLLRK